MCPTACGLDNFGLRVDEVVFDEVQARFNVSILKLDEVQPSGDLLLHGYLVQLVTSCLLRHRADGNTRLHPFEPRLLIYKKVLLLVDHLQEENTGKLFHKTLLHQCFFNSKCLCPVPQQKMSARTSSSGN